MPQFVATELERIGAKYLAAKKGYKLDRQHFTNLFGTAAVDKATKLFRGILQDFAFVDPGRAWAGVGSNNRK